VIACVKNLIMEEITEPKHIPHKDKNIAYHMDWEFRKEAAVWIDGWLTDTSLKNTIGSASEHT